MTVPTPEERSRFLAAQAAAARAAREAAAARVSLLAAREAAKRARRAPGGTGPADATVKQRSAAAQHAAAAVDVARKPFALADPRQSVALLDDRTPILLFPLRLETRFGTGTRDGKPIPQLWVRVYPDDCLVDAFQALPSETELASIRRYWANVWKARGIEAQERGAWRSLVASHGSGRAAWLERNHRPLNLGARPDVPAADALVLVVSTEAPLAASEAAAVAEYWRAVWIAGGAGAAVDAARDALVTAVGGDAARAQALVAGYEPVNLSDEPPRGLTRAQVDVRVAYVVFPPLAAADATTRSWSQPARTYLLPERLVLVAHGFDGAVVEQLGNPIPWPLSVGPDPQAPEAERIRQEGGEVIVGSELEWLTRFDRAVEVGMGFRLDLGADAAAKGFERLFVAGVQLSTDALEGEERLAELLAHHRDGSSGLAVLRQGTPTNNTEEEDSGFTRTEEADRTFDERLRPGPALRANAPWAEKTDGEWLADALGVEPALLDGVGGSRNTDQLEAQAMNAALWPATLGFGLETVMHPLLDGDDVDRVRWFHERFVSGRGLLPAIRIGRQPYAVLPTTALSRLSWTAQEDLAAIPGIGTPPRARAMLVRLAEVLAKMGGDWAELSKKVSRVGAPTADPHRTLLDILGLEASSVEHHQRFGQSLADLYNRLRFFGAGAPFMQALVELAFEAPGMALLAELGDTRNAVPEALRWLFLDGSQLLGGPFVDEVPLSEVSELQPVTAAPANYIGWLRSAATTSLDALRLETGFTGNRPPRALLYLLLRHALLQAYWDAGLRLAHGAEVMSAAEVLAARREVPFVHVRQGPHPGESRWELLYSRNVDLTGDPTARVADHLTRAMPHLDAAGHLRGILGALRTLEHVPTARLERLFAEHLDACTYRLDAWQQGLVHHALAWMRYAAPPPPQVEDGGEGEFPRTAPARKGAADVLPAANRGVYLGAFGWLEQVVPRARRLDPVRPIPGLDPSFHAAGLPPLVHDPTNGGYVLAPSLNQAVAAAVLRNGYLANAAPASPGTFAVNLSSARVRVALSFVEGLRQGQSLGALLGYQLERGLHDGWTGGEVDQFILPLRKRFPLAADRHPDTASGPADPIDAVEAKNVVDGAQLVQHVKKLGAPAYPFGLDGLPPADDGQRKVLDAEVARLLDTADALADLRVAEAVFHAVQGNYDRVAAALESSGTGQLPPEPSVVETPRSGRTITHRVAIHLQPGLDGTVSPVGGVAVSPRARVEPAVNAWLAGLLPAPDQVACTVSWVSPIDGTKGSAEVTQQDLGLQPIDLLHVGDLQVEQAQAELDERILLWAQARVPRPDCAITIAYRTPIPGRISFFELAALVRSARTLVLQSRALRPTDMVPPGAASSALDVQVRVDPARVTAVQTSLEALGAELGALRDELAPLHQDPVDVPQIVAGLDDRLARFTDQLARAASFGLFDAGLGVALERRRAWFGSAVELVSTLAVRSQERLDDCDARLQAYDAGQGALTDPERVAALAAAERQVRATLTVPPPATPALYRQAVAAARATFAARLAQVRAVLAVATTSMASFRAAVHGALDGPPPLAELDRDPVDAAPLDDRLVELSAELLARAKRLAQAIQDDRVTPAKDLVARASASADPVARARLLVDATKKLLGEAAVVVPELALADAQAAPFQAAHAAGVAGDPLAWQRTVKRTAQPVDTWLYGVARVREKLRAWEQALLLAGALGGGEPELVPLQLPWKPGEHWLGLEFPEGFAPDGDRLCYTAHFPGPVDASTWQCGLLVDEWTEVIPGGRETTALTFHFDRPGAEAPQALLLVTPPAFTGAWQWLDVLDAVRETLERAKSRAVEPAHVDQTPYARFLPMTVMAATLYQVSIMTNLARNNLLAVPLEAANDG